MKIKDFVAPKNFVLVFAFFLGFTLPILAINAAESSSPSPSKSAKREQPFINPFAAQPKVDVVSDVVEYDRNRNLVIAKGNVVVRDGDKHLTCDYAEVATDSKKVYAKGHVVVFHRGKAISRGQEIHYDFGTQVGSYPDGRLVTIPWIISGKEMNQVSPDVNVVNNGSITTCDYEKPHYELRASKVTVHQGDKMVLKNIKLYVLDKPVFWWPFMVLPLKDDGNLPFAVNVGYNSRHGYYIETSAGFGVTKHISGKWHADYRSLRGAGGGVDFHYDYHDKAGTPTSLLGEGVLKTYITHDKRAPGYATGDGYNATDERTRGRVTWVHRTDIDKHTNVILRYNRISDEYFLSDFFRHESRAEIEPQSFVTVTKNSENYGFFTHVEKKANRFESTVERLPEVRFDWKTAPFFNDHIFYENEASYNNLAMQFSRNEKLNHDVNRYDTFHEWSVPLNWRNLKFTPFANVRGTDYSRQLVKSSNAFRGIVSTGIDARTHFYKVYDVTGNKAGIEINQLRHIVEPVAQYKIARSSVSSERLAEFDRVDHLDDANIVTLGVENRLQTKRVVNGRMQRVDIVSLNTYLSYEANPENHPQGSPLYPDFRDTHHPEGGFTVGSQEIVLRPYNWLQSETRFDYDLGQVGVRVFNQDLVFRKGKFKVVFGYRKIRNFDLFEGNEQYVFDGSYILNPLWTLAGYVRWYGGDLQEWQVMATRDLHDFILDLGYNVRNSAIQKQNTEIFVNFRLKAFPELALRSGSRATFAEPRIGPTVAGSNQDLEVPSQNQQGMTPDYFR